MQVPICHTLVCYTYASVRLVPWQPVDTRKRRNFHQVLSAFVAQIRLRLAISSLRCSLATTPGALGRPDSVHESLRLGVIFSCWICFIFRCFAPRSLLPVKIFDIIFSISASVTHEWCISRTAAKIICLSYILY